MNSKHAQETHNVAFNDLCQYVEDTLINNSNAERLTMLKEKYLFIMENYKTNKLKI